MDEVKPKSVVPATSPPRALSERLIREALPILAEAFHLELSSAQVNIYVHYLADMPPERIKAAVDQAILTWRRFPYVAELRQLGGVGQQEQLKLEAARDHLDAERAWDRLLAYIREWGADRTPLCHGRTEQGPILERAEPLEPETDWAVRQCGGYECVATAPADKMHFIRQDFIKHYERYRETAGLREPTREEANRLIGKLVDWGRVDRILQGGEVAPGIRGLLAGGARKPVDRSSPEAGHTEARSGKSPR